MCCHSGVDVIACVVIPVLQEDSKIERIEMQRQNLSQQLRTMLETNNNSNNPMARAAMQKRQMPPVILDQNQSTVTAWKSQIRCLVFIRTSQPQPSWHHKHPVPCFDQNQSSASVTCNCWKPEIFSEFLFIYLFYQKIIV